MSDFDKDGYLSDADDLNRLSHQDGPQGSSPARGAADGRAVSVAGARADSDATASASSASSVPEGAAAGAASGEGSPADRGQDSDHRAEAAADRQAVNSDSGQHSGQDGRGTDSGTNSGADSSHGDGRSDQAGQNGSPTKADGSLTELGKAKKEAADYLEALQRERADFVNYRHRTAREKEDYRHRGQEDVLKALLPALDNLDRLREHGKMTAEVTAIAKQLDHGFEAFHITKFGEKGEAFDPARHEAILHRTSPDVDAARIDAVVESGYELAGKILRAAKVVVVSPQEEKPAAGGAGATSPDTGNPGGTDTPDKQ